MLGGVLPHGLRGSVAALWHARCMDDHDRLAALVVEACALVERAACHGLDDDTWAILTHVRAQLCLLATEADDPDAADAACEVVCGIDAALAGPALREERGAA